MSLIVSVSQKSQISSWLFRRAVSRATDAPGLINNSLQRCDYMLELLIGAVSLTRQGKKVFWQSRGRRTKLWMRLSVCLSSPMSLFVLLCHCTDPWSITLTESGGTANSCILARRWQRQRLTIRPSVYSQSDLEWACQLLQYLRGEEKKKNPTHPKKNQPRFWEILFSKTSQQTCQPSCIKPIRISAQNMLKEQS